MNFVKYTIYGLFAAAFIAAYLFWTLPDNRFHIYFLDVGQGDAILIKSPDNRYILADGGPTSSTSKLVGNILGNINRKIDLIILSHPHSDHYFGLIDIVKKFEIGTIILPQSAGTEPMYNKFLDEIAQRNIKTTFLTANTDIDFGAGIYIDSITPDLISKKSANESCTLIRILYGKLSIMLTGDAPIEEELALLQTNLDSRADILKVGHHGSKTSTSEEFLSSTQSNIAVIQSGINNNFGHPHAETISRLQKFNTQIFRNDKIGTIEFVF